MKRFLNLLALLIVIVTVVVLGLYMSGDRDEVYEIAIQGIAITADTVDWDPDAARLEAGGRVALRVPNLAEVSVSAPDERRVWSFNLDVTANLRAESATIDFETGIIEAAGAVLTTSPGEDSLTLEEPAISLRYRKPEVMELFREAQP